MGHQRKIGIISYIRTHVSERQLILLLSLAVGALCASAAFILKMLIHGIQCIVEKLLLSDNQAIGYFICPTIGILLTSLFVRYIIRDDISHGITKILYAISQRKSIIKVHNTWSSIVGSAITIGFGGSVGAEAPIVLTGAAIGSNMAKLFRLSQRTMMLMIGCGAAGAIGGIFKAPIAGLVFTIEVLLVDLTMSNVAPLLLSSIIATIMTCLLTDSVPLFQIEQLEMFQFYRLPWYILLGFICGFVSLYFTKMNNGLERRIRDYIKSPFAKILSGGIVLGVLIYFFPPLFGEGYDTIKTIINSDVGTVVEKSPLSFWKDAPWLVLVYLLLLVMMKVIACVCTNGGGGVGGIFAPSLFTGAVTGAVFAKTMLIFHVDVPVSNFALVGMAGLMSGVMHAPLTGIFLIAELTGGYHLFIPLIIVAVISYQTILVFEPHSLYAMRLAQKGELLTHNKDKSVLTLLKIHSIIENDFTAVTPQMTLGELVKTISRSNRNIFPVLDEKRHLLGILLLDDVRNIMFQTRLYNRFVVSDLMTIPEVVINDEMPMGKIMDIFDDTNAWNLPVVNAKQEYVGFVSKSKIFNSYRHVLVHFSEE